MQILRVHKKSTTSAGQSTVKLIRSWRAWDTTMGDQGVDDDRVDERDGRRYVSYCE